MRKVPEIVLFQALGSFETLGSKLSHGTSSKFADVRTHLRKVFIFNLTLLVRTQRVFGLFLNAYFSFAA